MAWPTAGSATHADWIDPMTPPTQQSREGQEEPDRQPQLAVLFCVALQHIKRRAASAQQAQHQPLQRRAGARAKDSAAFNLHPLQPWRVVHGCGCQWHTHDGLWHEILAPKKPRLDLLKQSQALATGTGYPAHTNGTSCEMKLCSTGRPWLHLGLVLARPRCKPQRRAGASLQKHDPNNTASHGLATREKHRCSQ